MLRAPIRGALQRIWRKYCCWLVAGTFCVFWVCGEIHACRRVVRIGVCMGATGMFSLFQWIMHLHRHRLASATRYTTHTHTHTQPVPDPVLSCLHDSCGDTRMLNEHNPFESLCMPFADWKEGSRARRARRATASPRQTALCGAVENMQNAHVVYFVRCFISTQRNAISCCVSA